MEKLKLEHLAPYLPYDLNGKFQITDIYPNSPKEIRNKILVVDIMCFFLNYCKPILRPLSDLDKEIEINGNKYFGSDEFSDELWIAYKNNFADIDKILSYESVIELIKRHFDIFGLIEKGLAIDINTLKL